jgi:TolB-like protein
MKNNPSTKENQHDSASLMERISKNLFLFIISIAVVGVQAVFAAKQTVAVLPSEGILKDEELIFFTDKAQEIAVQALPKSSFEVFPRDVIIKRLGGIDNYIKECKESSCIVELGKKAMVDYIAQCSFGKLGSDLTVTFELYKVNTEGLIDKFVDKAKNTDGLRAIMEKRIPDGFMKIPGISSVSDETSKPKNASPSAAGGVFKDNSLGKCPNGSYVNSQGNTVCRPSSSNTGGATAVCKDGTYSYSQNRRGTCSRHGGVARWL